MYKDDAEKLGVTENDIAILRTLGFQKAISYRETLDEALTYFEEVTDNNPQAIIGLSVFLNTFLVTLIKNWEVYPKNINEESKE